EIAGVRVDPQVLSEQSSAMSVRIEALRDQIHTAAGRPFNIDSPKQLGEVLFDELGLRSVKKTKTGHSTDVEVLEKLAEQHPVPKLVLEYRSLGKLKNTYLDQLGQQINPRTGRIHTSFNQTGAATGRLSSSDPNLQNIPIRTDEGRRIRLAFVT
ncbi:MAG TPA: DNA polymerase, partial [Tepidisphaeraceae bacterium]|nr:DNA polymerase [Tepidisphaeraceae bacterium]